MGPVFRDGGRRREVAPVAASADGVHVEPVERPGSGAVAQRVRAQTVLYVCTGILLAVALGLWWWALDRTNLADIGGVGLINALPLAYYVALGIVLAAVVLTLVWTPFSRAACGAGLVALVVVVFGAPAVLYQQPQYAWVYKHLGVIRYLELHGTTDRTLDIYQNWPGLFAGNAWLAKATGLDPGAYAAWAPVFFDLALLAAVLYALGGLIADPRRRYGAAFLWLLGSWVGQDYLSPQAMSIVVVVTVLGIVLRIGSAGGWAAAPRTRVGETTDAWRRSVGGWLRDRLTGGAVVRGPSTTRVRAPLARRDRAIGVGLVLVLSAATITSHQLSPGTLLFDLVLLTVFTGWRLLWPVIAAIAVGEIAWIAISWHFVSKFGIFTVDGHLTPAVNRGTPLAGVAIVQDTSRAMAIAFWLLALAGVVRMLRRSGGDPATPAAIGALALTPYLIVPVQSYGGEASLRAYLFSLPWLAVLSLEAIWPSGVRAGSPAAVVGDGASDVEAVSSADRRGPWALAAVRRRPWALAVVSPLLAAGLLVSYFGYALSNEMTTADVAATTWVENTLPARATVFTFSPSVPNKLTARYPLISYYGLTLSTVPATAAAMQVPGQRAAAVRKALQATGRSPIYLLVTPSMGRYDRLNGLFPEAQVAAVVAELRAAPDFTVVYDRGGSVVLRYTPITPPHPKSRRTR